MASSALSNSNHAGKQPTFSPKSPWGWLLLALIIGLALYQAWEKSKQEQADANQPVVANEGNSTPPQVATNEPLKGPPTTGKNSTQQQPVESTNPTNHKLPPFAPASGSDKAGIHRVTHVADGDTFNLSVNNQRERVRMIGMNCPEIAHPEKGEAAQPWSGDAQRFTENVIKQNRDRLRVDFDPEYKETDDYGRWLCWVYYTDSKTGTEKLLNEELVRQGLAFVYHNRRTYHFSESMYRRLKAAEDEAKRNKRGIYSVSK